MKNYLIVLSFLLIVSCQFSNSKCDRFHEGSFKSVDKNAGTTYITRKTNIQTEINNDIGYSVKLSVNWVNDCKYNLRLIQVLDNKANIPFDTSLVLTVEIIESKENSYTQRTSSNKNSLVQESEIFKTE